MLKNTNSITFILASALTLIPVIAQSQQTEVIIRGTDEADTITVNDVITSTDGPGDDQYLYNNGAGNDFSVHEAGLLNQLEMMSIGLTAARELIG